MNMSNDTDTRHGITPFVSYYVYTIFLYVVGLFLICGFSLFGLMSNISNIIVYTKMGFSKTTNISLVALSGCDLLVSLSMLFVIISNSPFFATFTRLPSRDYMKEIIYLGAAVLYSSLGLGACVTAILSTERCLAVVLPLKVKSLVTPLRITMTIGALVVYQIALKVVLSVMSGPPYTSVNHHRHLYLACAFSYPTMLSFIIVSVSTAFLVVRLKTNLSWRNKTSGQTNSSSAKDLKATRASFNFDLPSPLFWKALRSSLMMDLACKNFNQSINPLFWTQYSGLYYGRIGAKIP
ncbi:chemosensory receptor A [Elysia marginata]|uniref:Chemosensory receptor A n=1 Tax=Elysia marginata TaxID=1093978 RepID=A0AAV4GCQ9_9GAST|nr:chemosensory receptor A [Elysia marginata]